MWRHGDGKLRGRSGTPLKRLVGCSASTRLDKGATLRALANGSYERSSEEDVEEAAPRVERLSGGFGRE